MKLGNIVKQVLDLDTMIIEYFGFTMVRLQALIHIKVLVQALHALQT